MARTETQVLKAVTSVNTKIRKLTGQLEAAWLERRDLYAEARTLTPPVPHAKVAAAAGTTEAAVMQVIAKAHEAELTTIVSDRLNGDHGTVTAKELRTAVKTLVAQHGSHEAAMQAARTANVRTLRAATRS